ncbi:MAG TPA: FHA domain-containing protein, partial [Pyrinomonadaceae bacterium]|nr:FHA domain-containing protein [Pyrinomonadaceae bacterium]
MSKSPEKKHDEALAERALRRMLEGMGAVVDRKIGREATASDNFTTVKLIERMKRLINERTRDERGKGRVAPHLLKLKIEWGTHSESSPEAIKELEHEILAAAIDHINDARLRTLAPVKIETVVDIFTTGIAVEPTFGEFEDELKLQDEARQRAAGGGASSQKSAEAEKPADVPVTARANFAGGGRDINLSFKPGGRRMGVGRAAGSDLCFDHPSVSKVHAALVMNREGTLMVADT